MTALAAQDIDPLTAHAALLEGKYAGADAAELMRGMIVDEFPRRIALVSSFGTESAVLLHMAAQIDPTVDVVFVDTGKLFGETRRYRDRLVERLGLSGVRTIRPLERSLNEHDPKGDLWSRNPDLCCFHRKVEPLQRALKNSDAWISGRKRFQAMSRRGLGRIEVTDGRLKVNPLADWSKEDLDGYFERHDLPRHPLEADGFLSIGCLPCTQPVEPGEDARAGRWRGIDKTECGIHMSADGPVRTPA